MRGNLGVIITFLSQTVNMLPTLISNRPATLFDPPIGPGFAGLGLGRHLAARSRWPFFFSSFCHSSNAPFNTSPIITTLGRLSVPVCHCC